MNEWIVSVISKLYLNPVDYRSISYTQGTITYNWMLLFLPQLAVFTRPQWHSDVEERTWKHLKHVICSFLKCPVLGWDGALLVWNGYQPLSAGSSCYYEGGSALPILHHHAHQDAPQHGLFSDRGFKSLEWDTRGFIANEWIIQRPVA